MKRFVGFAVVALFLVGMFTWARSAARLQGTSTGQVRAAILEAVQAADEGRVSEAMRVVSDEYKDSTGLNRDRLWILLRRAADNKQYWAVNARRITPKVEGPEAVVDVIAAVNAEGEMSQRTYPMTLTMRLEDTHVWGVVPTRRWRIVSAGGLPDDLLGLGD